MKNNKVKFNICNCHYALQKAQENGEMAFERAQRGCGYSGRG